jgi:tRNA-specific 2-thiouridylase
MKIALSLGADCVYSVLLQEKEIEVHAAGNSIALLAGADNNKIQSYFLCQLSQEQL